MFGSIVACDLRIILAEVFYSWSERPHIITHKHVMHRCMHAQAHGDMQAWTHVHIHTCVCTCTDTDK